MEVELQRLLQAADTKQVLAFESVSCREYGRYAAWVERVFSRSDTARVQEGLYPMLQYLTIPEQDINYWELLGDLRSSMRQLRLVLPEGAEGRMLYLLGFLQEFLSERAPAAETSMYDVILWLQDIIDEEHPAFQPFQDIIEKQRYNDTEPFYTEAEKRADLKAAAELFLRQHPISVLCREGMYVITVE